jgi:hypothetical protein
LVRRGWKFSTDENRWDENAGLRRDAIRSQVIDAVTHIEDPRANPLTGNGEANFIAEISCKFVKDEPWHEQQRHRLHAGCKQQCSAFQDEHRTEGSEKAFGSLAMP